MIQAFVVLAHQKNNKLATKGNELSALLAQRLCNIFLHQLTLLWCEDFA